MHKNIIFFSLFAITIVAAIFAVFLNSNKETEEIEEAICTEDFKPVCGDNGKTYTNTCKALASDVGILREGACEDKTILTLDSIKNTIYNINGQYVKFENGGSNNAEIYKYAFGDLDSDNLSDAAVIIDVNGDKELTVILNDNGSPIYWTSKSLNSEAINVKIENKLIIIDFEKGEDFKYKLEGTKLIER
ncbi:MAG: Kazal-type serine protease inhibitor family protein [Candidatus Pacebacteria bacterium]|nr:Kazal-type serine protease inhibitor family protein [Candidatus Paceibacterota bacterium]